MLMGRNMFRRFVYAASAMLLAACSAVNVPFGADDTQSSTPTPIPKMYSPYSGVEVDQASKPILVVKIENTRAARPHLGLTSADIVWVEQVEAGITRFAVLFSSSLPQVVGPIRSARITDIDLLHPFGSVAFSYSGAQSKLRSALSAARFIDVSGDKGPSGYFRAQDRRSPHNFMGVTRELIDRAGPDVATAQDIGWTFGPIDPAAGIPVESMTAKWPGNRMGFAWDAANGRWEVSSDGEVLMAAEGGTVTAANVVVQYVDYVPSIYRDSSGNVTPEAVLIGTGSAMVLRDGVAIEALWSRTTADSHTAFTDTRGAAIAFSPGTQWILLVDKDSPVTLMVPASSSPSSSPTP